MIHLRVVTTPLVHMVLAVTTKTLKGLLIALSLAIFCGCSFFSPPCRQWEIYEIASSCPSFHAGKLVLKPDMEFSRIEVEISRNRFGIHIYLNLLCSHAYPCQDDPKQTELKFVSENGDEQVMRALILEGGQRLLLSKEDSAVIIQSLLENNSSTIQLGRAKTVLMADSFSAFYQELVAIPIPQVLEEPANFVVD